MKSDTLIHEIIADFADGENNERLRSALKALRIQTKNECLKVFKNSIEYTKLLYKL